MLLNNPDSAVVTAAYAIFSGIEIKGFQPFEDHLARFKVFEPPCASSLLRQLFRPSSRIIQIRKTDQIKIARTTMPYSRPARRSANLGAPQISVRVSMPGKLEKSFSSLYFGDHINDTDNVIQSVGELISYNSSITDADQASSVYNLVIKTLDDGLPRLPLEDCKCGILLVEFLTLSSHFNSIDSII